MRISKTMVLFVMMVLLASVGAFAQTAQESDTATLTLTGSVAKFVKVVVTPVGDYNALNLMEDVTDLKVATVNELSNVNAGYTVSLESANAAAAGLENPEFTGGAGDDTLQYTIKYDGSDVTFSGGNAATITDASSKTGGTPAGINKDLAISYSGTTVNIYEGEYSDTLTFTITAK